MSYEKLYKEACKVIEECEEALKQADGNVGSSYEQELISNALYRISEFKQTKEEKKVCREISAPLTKPIAGDVVRRTNGVTRRVTKSSNAAVWYSFYEGGEEISCTIEEWRIEMKDAEVIHAAD